MLHSAVNIRGFHLHASDGEIGHVDDILFDATGWAIRYLVIDTSNWIGGRSVLVSTATLTGIDPVERRINVAITRAEVKAAPSADLAEVPASETRHTIWII